MVTDSEPAPKPRRANNRTSSSGAEDRSSTITNTTAARRPTPAIAATSWSAQPRAGTSIAANTIAAIATATTAAPTQSTGGCSLSRDSAIVHANPASTTPATVNPTNTEGHDHRSSSTPAPRMPSTAPDPATPAHTPTARPRWAAANPAVRIDSVEGITSAAPTPASARAAISHTGSASSSGSADATENTASPVTSTPRRP
jgi:hypothetical protein